MGAVAAVGGLSALSSVSSGLKQNQQLDAQRAENERLNKQTWTAMGNQINTVNLQRGLLRQQTGTDLANIRKQQVAATGKSLASAAAAGIEGASVDDAASDILNQSNDAQARVTNNEQLQEVNLDTQVEDIINNAVASQRYSQKSSSTWSVLGSGLANGAMSAASTYALKSFNFMPTKGS